MYIYKYIYIYIYIRYVYIYIYIYTDKVYVYKYIKRYDIYINCMYVHILLRSHIHEYGHVQNRHVMFINDRTYKEHRNLGIRKHVTTSCSGAKPFY